MKDFFGNPIQRGDVVAIIHDKNQKLQLAKVTKLGAQKLTAYLYTRGRFAQTFRDPRAVVVCSSPPLYMRAVDVDSLIGKWVWA